ncbi:T9SS type A sorting domain-containing protein [Caldithrix abyssi]
MKYLYRVLLIWILPVLTLYGQKWHFDYVDTARSEQSAMTIDHAGKIHVTYYKTEGWPWMTNYAVQSADGWNVQQVAASNGNQSIAVDSENKPHIVFIGMDYHLYYATYQDDQWQTTLIDSNDIFSDNCIQLDALDRVHITYVGGTGNHYLKYALFDGSIWKIEIVDTAGMLGDANVLVLDSQNRPHILYGDGKHNTIKYCYWDGSVWQFTQFEMNQYHHGWLNLDQNDQPVLCVTNHGHDLVLLHFDGSQWNEEVVDPAPPTAETGKWSCFCFDQSGNPVLSFGWTDNWWNYFLYYGYNDGSGWKIEPVDTMEALTSNNVKTPKIVVDGQNDLHIIYATKNGAIKHATTATGTGLAERTQNGPVDFRLFQNYPNPFNAQTTIKYSLGQRATVRLALFNNRGQKLKELIHQTQPAGEHSFNLQAMDLSSGVYFYRMIISGRNGQYVQTRKMLLIK